MSWLKLNYLESDAALIVSCLPEEIDGEITEDQLPLFHNYAVLMRTKGVDTQLEDVHDAWASWASAAQPDHPALVPFEELTPEIQALDQPFLDAIREAAMIRKEGVAVWLRQD